MKCPKCDTEDTVDSQFCKKCAAPLPGDVQLSVTQTIETPLKTLEIGSLFADRYEVLADLDKSGMGEVYRVKDKKLDEEMALKLLRPEIAANEKTIERLKNELKLSHKIGHRNVCGMHDLGEVGDALHHHGVRGRGGFEEAVQSADQLLSIPEERVNGDLLRGFYHLWLGRGDRSLEEIRAAEALKAGSAVAILMEGLVSEEKRKEELAHESLKKWVDNV